MEPDHHIPKPKPADPNQTEIGFCGAYHPPESHHAAVGKSYVRSEQRDKVLMYIRDMGAHGAICDEIEIALNISHSACSPRLLELEGKCTRRSMPKMIVRTNAKRRTRLGCNAGVYVAVEFLK